MSVASSQAGLTTKAVEITNDISFSTTGTVYWSRQDNKTVYAYLSCNGYQSGTITVLQSLGLTTSISGGAELEYYVILQRGSSVIFESSWVNSTDLQYVNYRWDSSTTSQVYIYYYVRRVDGNDLAPNALYSSRLFANGYRTGDQEVAVSMPPQTTAIPNDWTVDTTQTFTTPTDIPSVSSIPTTDISTLETGLEIPHGILGVIYVILGYVGDILAFKYMTAYTIFFVVTSLLIYIIKNS